MMLKLIICTIMILHAESRDIGKSRGLRTKNGPKGRNLEVLADNPTHHLGAVMNLRNLKKKEKKEKKQKANKSAEEKEENDDENDLRLPDSPTNDNDDYCDPEGVNLADYEQWKEEEGYWLGDYSFYQSDGTPFSSSTWNYRYDSYKGFITGNVKGNAYRQRNVFLYPPQLSENCNDDTTDTTWGEGSCGINGNSKIFAADQNATTCSTNPEKGGDVSGPYQDIFNTTTELIGLEDNALLYQVYLFGSLFQSQLTTLTIDAETEQVRRTRSAQGFARGLPIYQSFYRERKVEKDEFYAALNATLIEYNILQSDTCTWIDNPSRNPPLISTGLEPGIQGCMDHLETSFTF